MKINELIVESQYNTYSKTLAYQLPLGIRSVKQLCDESIKIAINDVGLVNAGTIFTDKFILEMLTTYNNRCLQEGIGSFLGKTAGHVVGAVGAAGRGLKGAWNDAKQGYKDAKASWDPKNPPSTQRWTGGSYAGGTTQAAPQAGGTSIPAGGTTQAAPQAGANQGTTPPQNAQASQPAPASNGPQGGNLPNKGFGFHPHTGQPFASAKERADFDASPEAKMSTDEWEASQGKGAAPTLTPAQIRQQKQAAAAAAAQSQMAANPAPPKPAAPAPVAAPATQAAPVLTPDQIRQQKQAAAAAAAQSQMAPFSKVSPAPAVWKNNRDPSAPATSSPFKTQQQPAPTAAPAPVAAPAPTANYGQQATGYGKQTMNAPAGIPNVKKPAPAAPAVPPEDEEDNPNIQRGSNESKVFSKFLGRLI